MRRITSKDNIVEFAEVEYRPRGKSYQNSAGFQLPQTRVYRHAVHMPNTPLEEAGFELAQLTREQNVLSKAPRRQIVKTENAQEATSFV